MFFSYTVGAFSNTVGAFSKPMSQDAKYYRLAARIFADFSGTIAVPAVLAAILGQWLDEKNGTEPRYLMIFLVLAFIFTAIFVMRKAKMYKKAYEALIQEKS